MKMKTKTPPPTATPEELRARVTELAAVNDELFDLLDAQRSAYRRAMEDLLLTFVARGYAPAAEALLHVRRLFDGTQPKATH